jgi:hypothetical protein
VFLWGCAPYKPSLVPHLELSVHADTEFTLYERHVIDRAVEGLREQIGADIRIQYDLDYSNLLRLMQLKDTIRLTRVGSDAPIVRDIDLQFHGTVYGWTWLDRHMYVVWDRQSTERLMRHVVMHELLHCFGVPHVNVPGSVMYEQTSPGVSWRSSVEISEADREAIRKARKN